VPSDITGFTKYVLVDNLEDVLETDLSRITVRVNGTVNDTLKSNVTVTENAGDLNIVTLDIPLPELANYRGKYIELSIDANIKKDADISGYKNSEIPNQANLSIKDDPATDLKTEVVPVTPPNDNEPPITKSVGKDSTTLGNTLTLDALTTPYIYHVDVAVPAVTTGYTQIKIEDKLESVLTLGTVKILVDGTESTDLAGYITKDDMTNTVTFEINSATNAPGFDFTTLAGKKLTLEINSNIKDGADLSPYRDGSVPNTATLTFNGKPKTSNEVLVTPPDVPPTFDKSVNGTGDLTITGLDEALEYTLDITVPTNTKDITKIVLEDTFDSILKVGSPVTVAVLRDGTNDAALTDLATSYLEVNGQYVGLQIVGAAEANKFQGTTIRITVPATIDQTKDLASFLVDGKLPNTATLSYNPDPTKDIKDKATVTPPGEDPTPKKDVNGKPSLSLGTFTQVFTYHVGATVPSDITGFTKYVLVDNLEDVLETDLSRITVRVNGTVNDTLKSYVTVTENAGDLNIVTLDIPLPELANYRGKYIELSIDANIKEGADISGYKNSEIPNQANLSIKDDPATDLKTEIVPVTPPNDNEPPITKSVGKDSTTLGNTLTLDALTTPYIYHVDVAVPAVTTGYTQIKIEDKLESVLTLGTVKILVDGTESTDLAGYITKVDTTNTVTFEINSATNAPGFDFTTLAGKKLTLEINSNIKDGADLSPYRDGSVPNTATLTFNGKPKTSNEVLVTPPDVPPTFDKSVNGTGDLTITGLDEALEYTLDITVPTNTKDITKIVLEDTFDSILKVGSPVTVAVLRDGTNDAALTDLATSYLKAEGQYVGLQIVGAAEANKFQGTMIRITVPATIDQTKDLASFLVDGKLPNTATLSYNPDPTKDIKDKATVTPPGEDPTPKKDVNGKPSLSLGTFTQVFTYHVGATVPSDITGFTKYVLVDNLEDVLETDLSRITVRV
ncbi:isopeptide-forming domain-containing fimbrial protein, partial [Guggenheimella bovis]